MGQSPPGSQCNTSGAGLPLLNGPTEFTDHVVGEPRQWTLSTTKIAEEGDILFCVRGATAGRLNQAAYRAVIGRGLAAIRGEDHFDTAVIRFALIGGLSQLLTAAGGTIFPNISGAALRSFRLSWPPRGQRIEIAALLLQVETVMNSAANLATCGRVLRSALLADLVSGEHEIPAPYDQLLTA